MVDSDVGEARSDAPEDMIAPAVATRPKPRSNPRSTRAAAPRRRAAKRAKRRRGSDAAIAGHGSGERFLLLDPATLRALDVPLARIGTTLGASGSGPGEPGAAATAEIAVNGQAVRPPAPIGLRAVRRDGAIEISWTRRSRLGWAWLDGVDAPLGEDGERYRLWLRGAGGAERQVDLAVPAYTYLPGEQAADGWPGAGTLTATLVQVGTHAVSDPPARAVWTF